MTPEQTARLVELDLTTDAAILRAAAQVDGTNPYGGGGHIRGADAALVIEAAEEVKTKPAQPEG